jgi:hypothetical protein
MFQAGVSGRQLQQLLDGKPAVLSGLLLLALVGSLPRCVHYLLYYSELFSVETSDCHNH